MREAEINVNEFVFDERVDYSAIDYYKRKFEVVNRLKIVIFEQVVCSTNL